MADIKTKIVEDVIQTPIFKKGINSFFKLFSSNKAVDRELLNLSKKQILKSEGNYLKDFPMKDAIREARKLRSAASKARLKWMQENPDKGRVLKNGNLEFKNSLKGLKNTTKETYDPSELYQYIKLANGKKRLLIGSKIAGSSVGASGILSYLHEPSLVPYKTSTNKNEQAIADHKVNSNVKDPYWIFDKKTGILTRKQGNKKLASFRVMGGLNNQYDGYNMYDEYKNIGNFFDLSQHAMITPSGIFTFKPFQYEGKPAFRMIEGKRGSDKTLSERSLTSALHIMPKSRINDYNNGIINKSFGCINLPQNVLDYMVKNDAVNDSLYVLPVQDNNYIYESNEYGHPLKVQYNTKPDSISGKNYATKYNLKLKYNEGY